MFQTLVDLAQLTVCGFDFFFEKFALLFQLPEFDTGLLLGLVELLGLSLDYLELGFEGLVLRAGLLEGGFVFGVFLLAFFELLTGVFFLFKEFLMLFINLCKVLPNLLFLAFHF